MTQVTFKQGDKTWKDLRKKAREDLFFFNRVVLGHEEICPMTPRAHYPMCLAAQRKTGWEAFDNARVLLLQVPRGVGKSLNITKGMALWRLVQDRNYALGIANEKMDNAKAFLGMIKQEFETNQLLRMLFPECIPDFNKTEWKSDRITINRTRPNPVNPSVLAAGVDTTVTGVHMDEWIVDDLISQNAAENAMAGHFTEIEKAFRWCVRLEPLLTNPKRAPINFICTPWYLGDTYELIVNQKWGLDAERQQYMWTVKLPHIAGNPTGSGETRTLMLEVQGDIAIFRDPAIMDNGKPLFPERYNLDELDKLRKEDPYFFAAQYMLEPSAAEAAAFNPDWLKEFEWEGGFQVRFRNFEGTYEYRNIRDMTCIISVDPAISRKDTAARSAICVTASDGKHIFLLEAWAARVGATELAQQIINFSQRYNPMRVLIEKVGYQEALAEVLDLLAKEQKVGHIPVYDYMPGSDDKKEIRILGLEPYFRKGFFYIAPNLQDFKDEYTNFPNTRLRDILDALAQQKVLWEKMANRDADGHGGSMQSQWSRSHQKRANTIRERFGKRRRR